MLDSATERHDIKWPPLATMQPVYLETNSFGLEIQSHNPASSPSVTAGKMEQGCSSVVESLSCMCKALGLRATTSERRERRGREGGRRY